jgi:threonine aldolase
MPVQVASRRGFASDNNAGVHPEILEAIVRANQGHVRAYGDDDYTRAAMAKFEEHFGSGIEVFFTFNGTGANVLGLQALNRPYHAILCSDYAHIYTDECGAPEKHTGCKLIPLPQQDGKITVEQVRHAYHGIGDQHHVQARVISITQSTEMGTVYQPEEIRALADFAHEREMFLHMDGARIANAAVSLGQDLRQATRDLGVDVLTFGGTKNGMMGGEAVVFFRPGLSQDFLFLRKQGMQLNSKMRFVAVQFEGLLTNDLWRRSAEHANRMARLLERELRKGPNRVAGGGEWSLCADSAGRDCQDHGTIFLLSVDRGRVHCALDVFVRYDRRGCAGVCFVCGRVSKGMKPALYPPIAFRFSIE